jgi:glycerophosphoryl diester phosphodiesterase
MAQHSLARPARVAHRGAPREHPENTLPSFARALELGADAIELDVHATRDGVVVVHHDPVPRATSPDRRLARRAIAELTLDQLRTFNVASGVGIPTLAEVLALVGDAALVYVELKGANVEPAAIDVIRSHRTRCAVHSFDHAAVTRARLLAPEIRRGVLFSRRPVNPVQVMQAAGALDVWPEWPLIDAALVNSVHAVGGSVIAWTVNDVAVAGHLSSVGVDGICTDDLRIIDRTSAE